MANVLGELFGNIAAAIREKTGDTATMKPAEFPDKISAIEVGSGSGSESEDAVWTVATGSFVPTDAVMTCSHDLGVVPEILVVYAGHIPAGACLFFAIGFNSDMIALFEEGKFPGVVGTIFSSGGFMSYQTSKGMETNCDSSYFTGDEMGHIRNVTAATFTVGGSMANTLLNVGEQYYWRAYYKKPASE